MSENRSEESGGLFETNGYLSLITAHLKDINTNIGNLVTIQMWLTRIFLLIMIFVGILACKAIF